jgi:hypothetical protein
MLPHFEREKCYIFQNTRICSSVRKNAAALLHFTLKK